jgi:hypothetical protein
LIENKEDDVVLVNIFFLFFPKKNSIGNKYYSY